MKNPDIKDQIEDIKYQVRMLSVILVEEVHPTVTLMFERIKLFNHIYKTVQGIEKRLSAIEETIEEKQEVPQKKRGRISVFMILIIIGIINGILISLLILSLVFI